MDKTIEKASYEDSLKVYRDIKNSMDTAKEEGRVEGRIKEKMEIAKSMLLDGEPVEKIMKYTGLTIEQVENLKS